jgi:hypothetical protein
VSGCVAIGCVHLELTSTEHIIAASILSARSQYTHLSRVSSLMLRPMVSRPVFLGVTARFVLLSDSCRFVDVGRSL